MNQAALELYLASMLQSIDQLETKTDQQRIMARFLKAIMPPFIRAINEEITRNSRSVDVLGSIEALSLNMFQHLFQMAQPSNQHMLAESIGDRLKLNLHMAIDGQLNTIEFVPGKPS